MKKLKLPKTDSIEKLAEFWDSHDVTDYEDELEEVGEAVFARGAGGVAITVPLGAREAKAVERLAKAKGVSREDLVRGWVLQKIARRSN
jgi:hypothetical protein